MIYLVSLYIYLLPTHRDAQPTRTDIHTKTNISPDRSLGPFLSVHCLAPLARSYKSTS